MRIADFPDDGGTLVIGSRPITNPLANGVGISKQLTRIDAAEDRNTLRLVIVGAEKSRPRKIGMPMVEKSYEPT